MVLLGRGVIYPSHRLSIQTTVVSGTVWPQFAIHVLIRGCQPKFRGNGVVGSENGSLSSPVVTSLTIFAVLRLVTDRRTGGQTSKRRQSAVKH